MSDVSQLSGSEPPGASDNQIASVIKVEIKEENDQICVEFVLWNGQERKSFTADFKKEKCDSSDGDKKDCCNLRVVDSNGMPSNLEAHDGNVLDAVADYLEKHLEHMKNPWTFEICIKMTHWSEKLSSFFKKCLGCQWNIEMNETIYPQFMEVMRDISIIGSLNIERDLAWFKLPREFFDSHLFRSARDITCGSKNELTDEPFLASNFESLLVFSASVSATAVHKKLESIINENSRSSFTIFEYAGDDTHYERHRYDIIDGLSLEVVDSHEYRRTMPDGATAKLYFGCPFGGIILNWKQ